MGLLTKRTGYLTERKREAIAGYVFLLPWLLGFVFITGGPVVATLVLSFFKYDLVSNPVFHGIQNFIDIFTADPLFWKSIKITAIYTGALLPLVVIIALMFALLLNEKIKGMPVFRAVYYLPSILPLIASSFVWSWVLNPDFGVLNYLLKSVFGISNPPMWFGSEAWVIPAFLMISVWGMVGQPMIIFLAGMQSIPNQLYESATIDGAGNRHKFFHITLPMLSPIILYNIIMNLVLSWQVFTPTFALTQGGPNYGSYFYVYFLYQNAFNWFKMGYASALAFVFFIILLLLTMLLIRSSSMWIYYEAETK